MCICTIWARRCSKVVQVSTKLHHSAQPSPHTTPPNTVPTPLVCGECGECIPLHPTQSLHDSFQPSPHTSPSNPVPTPLLLTLSLHFSSGHRHYSTLPTHSLHHFSQPSPYAMLPCKWFNLEIRLSHYLYFFSAIHFPGACELSFFVALENRLCGLKG